MFDACSAGVSARWGGRCSAAACRLRRRPSCRRRPTRASALAPGLDNAGCGAARRRAAGQPAQAARLGQPRPGRLLRTPTWRSRATTPSSAASTASDLRHLQPGGAGAEDRRRLPGRPGRRLGLREPAVRVRRGDAGEEGLHARRRRRRRRRASAASASSTSRTSRRRGRSAASRPAAARTRTRWSRPRTTRTTSTSTSPARPARVGQTDDLDGCDAGPATNPNPSQWRIEVIKVPLAAPADRRDRQRAAAVQERADRRASTACRTPRRSTARTHPLAGIPGLAGPAPVDTNSCHDITVYEELDLAAGACEGNGLLIDISDPANPKRIDAVADPLFAYWHGATFSNDGKNVFFTDEWGGGTGRALPRDRPAELGRERDLRDRQPQARVPQLLQAAGGADDHRELRQPHPVDCPDPGPRHLRPGLVPGRRVAGRLHRRVEPEGDRLLRPRPDQRDHARARRLLVDVLVQRRDLRLGDRARLRLVQAHADARPDRRPRSPRAERRSRSQRFNAQSQEPFTLDVDAGRRRRGRQRAGDAVADARRAGAASARSRRAWRETYEASTDGDRDLDGG